MSILRATICSFIYLFFSTSAVANTNSDENQPVISPLGEDGYWVSGKLEEDWDKAKAARLELDSLLSEVTGMPLGTPKDSETLDDLDCELDEEAQLQRFICSNDQSEDFISLRFDDVNQLVSAYFSLQRVDDERKALIAKFEERLGSAQEMTLTLGPENIDRFYDAETRQPMYAEYPKGVPIASFTWRDTGWEDWELEIVSEGYDSLRMRYMSPKEYAIALAEAQSLSVYMNAVYGFLSKLLGLFLPLMVVYLSFIASENGWRDHHRHNKYKDKAIFFSDGRNIVFCCAFLSVLMLAGGPVCESGDMFGCEYYSDDYREPMTGPDALELFLELISSAAVGYWLAHIRWKKN